jgi:hypothetical protein
MSPSHHRQTASLELQPAGSILPTRDRPRCAGRSAMALCAGQDASPAATSARQPRRSLREAASVVPGDSTDYSAGCCFILAHCHCIESSLQRRVQDIRPRTPHPPPAPQQSAQHSCLQARWPGWRTPRLAVLHALPTPSLACSGGTLLPHRPPCLSEDRRPPLDPILGRLLRARRQQQVVGEQRHRWAVARPWLQPCQLRSLLQSLPGDANVLCVYFFQPVSERRREPVLPVHSGCSRRGHRAWRGVVVHIGPA